MRPRCGPTSTTPGTLQDHQPVLVLDKIDAVYRNTGTIDIAGLIGITIPASSGSPSFTMESGAIISSAANPNVTDFRMAAGTFTYNGGNALSTMRGLVTLEGVDLVFGPSPVGTATFSMLPSAAGNSFTGHIGATQTVRMPLVGGAQTMTSRTLRLVGNVVNAGTLEVQQSPSTSFPIIAGTGTLTNTGTFQATGTGGDSIRLAINLRNEGTMQVNGRFHGTSIPPSPHVNTRGPWRGTARCGWTALRSPTRPPGGSTSPPSFATAPVSEEPEPMRPRSGRSRAARSRPASLPAF